MKVNILIFFVMMLLLGGCTHTQVWEKTGGNQQTFNLDSRECEVIAHQISLQQSETGKTIDPVNYNKEYIECLGAKGWRRKVVGTEKKKEVDPEPLTHLAQLINGNKLQGFGQTIIVPKTYSLVADKQFQVGTTIIQQFFWKGEDSSFMNILFQGNTAHFNQIPYPVSEPYALYTSGQGEKAVENLQWATFYGYIEPDWIMGTGAYYYVGKKERIIVVITKPLDQSNGEKPRNVSITRNQYYQIKEFSERWQIWLNQQFQQGPGFLNQLKGLLRFGI